MECKFKEFKHSFFKYKVNDLIKEECQKLIGIPFRCVYEMYTVLQYNKCYENYSFIDKENIIINEYKIREKDLITVIIRITRKTHIKYSFFVKLAYNENVTGIVTVINHQVRDCNKDNFTYNINIHSELVDTLTINNINSLIYGFNDRLKTYSILNLDENQERMVLSC